MSDTEDYCKLHNGVGVLYWKILNCEITDTVKIRQELKRLIEVSSDITFEEAKHLKGND